MNQKFKIIFFFTLTLFVALIIINIGTDIHLQKDGWYSIAIMYFFSFSLFHIKILEKKINQGVGFVRTHLFLTGLKMFLSIMFIVLYGLVKGSTIETLFFVWFLILYLLYTALLGWLFYKKR